MLSLSEWMTVGRSRLAMRRLRHGRHVLVSRLGFSDQFLGSRSHAWPFHQSSALVTRPPQLARSARFSVVGACLHWICGCCFIFCTRLVTNCRYRSLPSIQWGATVLSNQAKTVGSGKSLSAFLTLTTKLVAMWVLTNSNPVTVRSLLANLAFVETRVCVIPPSWRTTEYNTALTP